MSLYVDIEKRFGRFRLTARFDTDRQVTALLGASGSGKSLTLKCIAGIVKPDRGKIILNGKTLFDSEKHINLKPQQRNAGYLFQNYALFPNMTVEQNIRCGIREGSVRTADGLMEELGLADCAGKYPAELSGGQQQRCALARILAGNPDILMLDEPFSALDTHLRLQMENLVKEAIKGFGKDVLLVSHDRDEVYRMAESICIMNDGVTETIGTREEIFADPQTVAGARLTGIRNISAFTVTGEDEIYASDWGMSLKACGPFEGKCYAGIRNNGVIFPAPNENAENLITCTIKSVTENPFSCIITVKTPSDAGFVFETDKDGRIFSPGDAVRIALPKEQIVLLK